MAKVLRSNACFRYLSQVHIVIIINLNRVQLKMT